MALNAPYTPNTVIQSTQVSNDLTGLANGSNDTATNSMSTFRSEALFDFVATACVWSGDAYASTKNGSQTSGVVYISGVRLPVSSVTARTFTASKDTYIDINGSGVQVYTEVTNNAASPVLAAGSLRLAIIITGASNIANAASINQGQETIILPIASSNAYAVTDSLGNLICPRDSTRKILGYRQIISAATGTTIADVVGLATPVIIPTGRKVRATVWAEFLSTSGAAGTASGLYIDEDSTQIQKWQGQEPVTGYQMGGATASVLRTATAGSHTYKVQMDTASGTITLNAGSASPAYILLELE